MGGVLGLGDTREAPAGGQEAYGAEGGMWGAWGGGVGAVVSGRVWCECGENVGGDRVHWGCSRDPEWGWGVCGAEGEDMGWGGLGCSGGGSGGAQSRLRLGRWKGAQRARGPCPTAGSQPWDWGVSPPAPRCCSHCCNRGEKVGATSGSGGPPAPPTPHGHSSSAGRPSLGGGSSRVGIWVRL